ncbi:centromere protein T isoform X2 [Petromyzon marinus]|uniref:centromere protein T isoform X2 n=1 Tax=Petromyzon marinus TaxID=7757 RepID=UPI003F6FB14A
MAQTPVSSAVPLRRPLGLSASKEKSARIRLLQLNFRKRLSAQAATDASPALSIKLPKNASTPDMSPYTLLKKIHSTAVEVSPVEVFKPMPEHVKDDAETCKKSETSSMFEFTPTDESESETLQQRHHRPMMTPVDMQTFTKRFQQAMDGRDLPALERSAMSSLSLNTSLDSEEEDDDAMGVKIRRSLTRAPTQMANKEAFLQRLQQHLREEAEEPRPAHTTDLMAGGVSELSIGEHTSHFSESSSSKRTLRDRSTPGVRNMAAKTLDGHMEVSGRAEDKHSDDMEENGVPAEVTMSGYLSPVIDIHPSPHIGTPILSAIQSGLQDSDGDGTGAEELKTTRESDEMSEEISGLNPREEAEMSSAELVYPMSFPHLGHTSPVGEELMGDEEGGESKPESDGDQAGPAGDALDFGRSHNLATSPYEEEEEEDYGSSNDEGELKLHEVKAFNKPSPTLNTPAFFTRDKLSKGKQKGPLKINKATSKRGKTEKMLKIPMKEIKNICQRFVPCRLNRDALLAIEKRKNIFVTHPMIHKAFWEVHNFSSIQHNYYLDQFQHLLLHQQSGRLEHSMLVICQICIAKDPFIYGS